MTGVHVAGSSYIGGSRTEELEDFVHAPRPPLPHLPTLSTPLCITLLACALMLLSTLYIYYDNTVPVVGVDQDMMLTTEYANQTTLRADQFDFLPRTRRQ